MLDGRDTIKIRIFLFGFALLIAAVLLPPTQSSLQKSIATVLVARLQMSTFHVEYDLGNGQTLAETTKTGLLSHTAKTDELIRMQGTQEKITIWHKKGKVWQIQKQNGQTLLSYAEISKKRYVMLALLYGVLIFMALYYPNRERQSAPE